MPRITVLALSPAIHLYGRLTGTRRNIPNRILKWCEYPCHPWVKAQTN